MHRKSSPTLQTVSDREWQWALKFPGRTYLNVVREPGSDSSWNYSPNNGQRVVETAARAIADAVDAALADAPDSLEEGRLGPGGDRAHLRKLIEFCREGSFRIF
jgi:hypothetical protein